MALKIIKRLVIETTTKRAGVVIDSIPSQADIALYCVVEYMQGTKAAQSVTVAFKDFYNQEVIYERKTYNGIKLALDGTNFVQQIYEELKTLPDFANSTDC